MDCIHDAWVCKPESQKHAMATIAPYNGSHAQAVAAACAVGAAGAAGAVCIVREGATAIHMNTLQKLGFRSKTSTSCTPVCYLCCRRCRPLRLHSASCSLLPEQSPGGRVPNRLLNDPNFIAGPDCYSSRHYQRNNAPALRRFALRRRAAPVLQQVLGMTLSPMAATRHQQQPVQPKVTRARPSITLQQYAACFSNALQGWLAVPSC